jgi:uncharacterized iron-regulated protein
MLRIFYLCIALLPPCALTAQVKQAYSLFSADGKKVSHEKMIHTLSDADVVFFGELHDNPIAHWLELQILKDLYAINNRVTLGMEMFEADDQIVLTEYLSGLIEEKQNIF